MTNKEKAIEMFNKHMEERITKTADTNKYIIAAINENNYKYIASFCLCPPIDKKTCCIPCTECWCNFLIGSNKQKIYNYCSTVKTHDIDHLSDALNNARILSEDDISSDRCHSLMGCPSSMGLDDYVGLCHKVKVTDSRKQLLQCGECWYKAIKEEE